MTARVLLRSSLALAAVLAFARVPAAAPGEVVRVPDTPPDELPSRGAKDALVTVELFFVSFTSSRSSAYHAVERLAAAHPSRVRVVYRVLRNASSSRLHYAALEAFVEGKFDAFFTELNKQSTSNQTDAQLHQIARAAGMNAEQLALVLQNPPAAFDHVLDENARRFRQHGGTTPPLVIVNGVVVRDASSSELERAYQTALDTAQDLVDRGVPRDRLAAALDAAAAPNPLDVVVTSTNYIDDGDYDSGANPQLATPPLDLRGMPSLGPATAPVAIAVLCNPASNNCNKVLKNAAAAQEVFGDRVRVVWAPFFDLTRLEAKDLGMLADAALCAERVGTSTDDFGSPQSPGWEWLVAVLDEIGREHRGTGVDRLLEVASERLHVEDPAFESCRAKLGGVALRWIEAARRAGVRVSPSVVVGGRIYPGGLAQNDLQHLISAELEPGDCDGCLRLDTLAPAWRGDDSP